MRVLRENIISCLHYGVAHEPALRFRSPEHFGLLRTRNFPARQRGKETFMDRRIAEIRAGRVRALRLYMAEAKKTCKLLTDLKEFPIAAEARSEIL